MLPLERYYYPNDPPTMMSIYAIIIITLILRCYITCCRYCHTLMLRLPCLSAYWYIRDIHIYYYYYLYDIVHPADDIMILLAFFFARYAFFAATLTYWYAFRHYNILCHPPLPYFIILPLLLRYAIRYYIMILHMLYWYYFERHVDPFIDDATMPSAMVPFKMLFDYCPMLLLHIVIIIILL